MDGILYYGRLGRKRLTCIRPSADCGCLYYMKQRPSRSKAHSTDLRHRNTSSCRFCARGYVSVSLGIMGPRLETRADRWWLYENVVRNLGETYSSGAFSIRLFPMQSIFVYK